MASQASAAELRDSFSGDSELKLSIQKMNDDWKDKVWNGEKKCGLAVLMGKVKGGPPGVEEDLKNMCNAFEKLNLVTFDMRDTRSCEIEAVVKEISQYEFPISYRFLILYYSGLGDSEGHAYIRTADPGENDTLPIKKLITPLLPITVFKEFPQVYSCACRLRRIFLFDFCQEDDSDRSSAPKQSYPAISKKASIPSYGHILIAYASSEKSSLRGSGLEGGWWTKYLSENLVTHDCPLTTILDLTWEQMRSKLKDKYRREINEAKAKKERFPLCCSRYNSSTGLIWLQHPGCDLKKEGRKWLPRRIKFTTDSKK